MLWACMLSCSVMFDSGTPWTIARQVPLSMGFPVFPEYWSGLLFYPPGDLPDPRIEPATPALAGEFFTIEPPRKSKSLMFIFPHGILHLPCAHFQLLHRHHCFLLWPPGPLISVITVNLQPIPSLCFSFHSIPLGPCWLTAPRSFSLWLLTSWNNFLMDAKKLQLSSLLPQTHLFSKIFVTAHRADHEFTTSTIKV